MAAAKPQTGWLFKIKLDSDDQLPPGLLSATEYSALIQDEEP